ncbi:uncharacterized protein LOC127832009 [Dreissena polymorpha]|uniref:uncharacterized protein LOC127832009 n=1 Tax=Dreissena polymorpha TaxID=45954 RepID=UPI0022649D17|nr:uncharacterized protein LOC127832009 [Dreissena polymorpha]
MNPPEYKAFAAGAAGFESSGSDASAEENKNTRRKTETDMRIFAAYLISVNESREPHTISPPELDQHLATYFSIIKKHDGNDYEAASLRGMLCSIERHLRANNYPVSLTRDAEFTNTRNMLKEKQRILREQMKTEKSDKQFDTVASIAMQKLNQLYNAKEFGPHNPSSVINALCFSFVVSLNIKKAVDHKQLLWGDICLAHSSGSNDEYLCYQPVPGYEHCRLPLKGISSFRIQSQSHEAFLWDPIPLYKLYQSKRPVSMMTPSSPFYLGVASLQEADQTWYKPVAMGVNKLNDLVRMIRDITGTLPRPHIPSVLKNAVNDIKFVPRYSDMFLLQKNESQNPDVQNDDKQVVNYLKTRECDGYSDNGSSAETASNSDENLSISDSTLRDNKLPSLFYNGGSEPAKANTTLEGVKLRVLDCLKLPDKETQKQLSLWLKSLRYDEDLAEWIVKAPRTMAFELTCELDGDFEDEQTIVPANVKIRRYCVTKDTRNAAAKVVAETPAIVNTSASRGSSHIIEDKHDHQNGQQTQHAQHNLKRSFSYNGIPETSNHCKVARLPDGNEEIGAPNLNTCTSALKISKSDTSEQTVNERSFPFENKAINPNVPFASWGYDPRLTMFLNRDMLQTYQNFIAMYSSNKNKG